MSIFSNMVERFLEVFMDDFLVFGSSFHKCLHNLSIMLIRCKETNLILSWEKSHFMGHIVSKREGLQWTGGKLSWLKIYHHLLQWSRFVSSLGMPASFDTSSWISIKFQDPCVVCLPRILLSTLMKHVKRHSRSSSLYYLLLPSWSLLIGLCHLKSCVMHLIMLWVRSWASLKASCHTYSIMLATFWWMIKSITQQ